MPDDPRGPASPGTSGGERRLRPLPSHVSFSALRRRRDDGGARQQSQGVRRRRARLRQGRFLQSERQSDGPSRGLEASRQARALLRKRGAAGGPRHRDSEGRATAPASTKAPRPSTIGPPPVEPAATVAGERRGPVTSSAPSARGPSVTRRETRRLGPGRTVRPRRIDSRPSSREVALSGWFPSAPVRFHLYPPDHVRVGDSPDVSGRRCESRLTGAGWPSSASIRTVSRDSGCTRWMS